MIIRVTDNQIKNSEELGIEEPVQTQMLPVDLISKYFFDEKQVLKSNKEMLVALGGKKIRSDHT